MKWEMITSMDTFDSIENLRRAIREDFLVAMASYDEGK